MAAPTTPRAEKDFVKKDQRSKCPCCKTGFGFTTWKYHCHMCGEVVCDNCSSGKLTLPPVWTAEPVRVCKPCWPNAVSLGGKTPNQGRVLGSESKPAPAPTDAPTNAGTAPAAAGSSDSAEAAERRARMAAAAAARNANAPGRPAAKKSAAPAPKRSAASPPASAASTPAVSREATSDIQPAVESDGGPSGAEVAPAPAVTQPSQDEARTAMLEAAMRRKQAQAGTGRPQSATLDPQRVMLLEQVRSKLRKKGMEEPFGLAGMDRVKLQSYLNRLNEM